MSLDVNSIILRFFRDEIQGILITGEDGAVLYEDEKAAWIRASAANLDLARPLPRAGQKGEIWDLPLAGGDRAFMAITSTFHSEDGLIQIHYFVENSAYMALYRDINGYARMLQDEKEHDGMTGLYNKGKFLAMKKSFFQKQPSIAVFNMDVNNLKEMNDTFGHEAGDLLLKKAAESLRRIAAKNIFPFRVGGDEFLAVAVAVSREETDRIYQAWESGLRELNQRNDGVPCVIACGIAYGEAGYDLEEVLALADQRMYEDKIAKKGGKG